MHGYTWIIAFDLEKYDFLGKVYVTVLKWVKFPEHIFWGRNCYKVIV